MSNSAIEKFSALVPEVWFDLIARVVPGAVIVLAASSTGSGLELPFGGLAVGLVGVYVVGYTFDVVSRGASAGSSTCCQNMSTSASTHTGNCGTRWNF